MTCKSPVSNWSLSDSVDGCDGGMSDCFQNYILVELAGPCGTAALSLGASQAIILEIKNYCCHCVHSHDNCDRSFFVVLVAG